MAFNSKNILIVGFAAALISGCSPNAQFAELTGAFSATPTSPRADVAEVETDETEQEASSVLAFAAPNIGSTADAQPGRAKINQLIAKYARQYNVPESLAHHVVNRESTYKVNARNGIHIGLMQLNPTTARTMGFRGSVGELYYPENNLKYGIKYLAGAYLVAEGNAARADKLYQSGYYYHAKRMGLLQATGLRP